MQTTPGIDRVLNTRVTRSTAESFLINENSTTLVVKIKNWKIHIFGSQYMSI